MKWILQLAVIGAMIFFVVKYVVPWLAAQGEGLGRSGSAVELSDSECVDQARRAADTFASEIRAFRPPVDLQAWQDAKIKIEDRIYAAQSTCSCLRTSCNTGQEALSNLAGLTAAYESSFRGDGMPPLNAAREIDRVFDLLNDAAAQARSGD